MGLVQHLLIAALIPADCRRHGRLAVGSGLNPVPADIKPDVLTTAIDFDDSTATLDLTLSVAGYFEFDETAARKIVAETARAVSRWRDEPP